MDWDSLYRVSPALSLRIGRSAHLEVRFDEQESRFLELTPDELEVLRHFGETCTPREVYDLLAGRYGEVDRDAFAATVRGWIQLRLLVEDSHRAPLPARLQLFRAAVERCLASDHKYFPLRSALPGQRPNFFYPGLDSQEFHDPAALPWCAELERAFPAIRAEVIHLVASRLGFETKSDRFTSTGEWAGAYLWTYGRRMDEIAGWCPATMSTIERIQGAAGIGTALFSALSPDSFVSPHHGNTNAKLRCQLPLVVPSACVLRVGEHERRLEEGKCIVFDDSFLHSASSGGGGVRIILIVDFFHPDLTPPETAFTTQALQLLDPSAKSTAGDIRNASFPDWLTLTAGQ